MIATIQNKFKKIILASQSPRRRELMARLGLQFDSISLDADETFPLDLNAEEVAPFLSQKKAQAYKELQPGELLITCDTTVCLNGAVINKPLNHIDASNMLRALSANKHTVVTGVTLTTLSKTLTFNSHTEVFFNELSESEINYYVSQFEVLDKAGAYGIQDWIGYSSIEKINGCFYNVMGLPTSKLYSVLKEW